jgi:molybdopterin synthase sulfur carrier subunit
VAIKVLLFGRLRDVAGWRERDLDPAPARLSELRRRLIAETPALEAALAAPGVQAAVDCSLVRGDCALSAGAEVAFMPAMSGG